VLSVEDWAEIRRLCRSEQLSIPEVARMMGVARNTVKAAFNPHAQRAGARVAAGVSAAGPGLAHDVSGWADRAVRLVVSRRSDSSRSWSDAHGHGATGDDDGLRVFAVGLGAADSQPQC
jgi:hypothetical protein